MPKHAPYHTPVAEFGAWLVWTLAVPVRDIAEDMRLWRDTCHAWLDIWQPGSVCFLGRRALQLARWPVPLALGLAACVPVAVWAVRP